MKTSRRSRSTSGPELPSILSLNFRLVMTVVTDYFQSNIGDDQDQGEEQDPVGPSPDPLHRARSQETGD